MMHHLFIVGLLFSACLYSTENMQRKAELLVTKCYAHTGISVKDQAFIEKLIKTIEETSPLDQIKIAGEVQASLHKIAHQLKKDSKKTCLEAEKTLLKYQLKLVTIQEKHLERFAALTLKKQPLYKQAADKTNIWLSSTFGTKKSHLTQTAQDLLAYTKLERNTILAHPTSTISFFHAQNNAALPRIMAFWWYKPEQQKIIKAVKKTITHLEPCAAVLDVAAEASEEVAVAGEGAAEIGVEGATQAVAEADSATVEQLEQESAQLTTPEGFFTGFTNKIKSLFSSTAKDVGESSELEIVYDYGIGRPQNLIDEEVINNQKAILEASQTQASDSLENATQDIQQKTGVFNALKSTYNKGLVGITESVLKTSADTIENGLVKLQTKYPDSAALQIVAGTFKAARGTFGAMYKYTPLGLIKWLSNSPSGKMMYDMLKLTLVMSGSSMYNSWINQQTFAAYATLSTFKVQLASAMQNTLATIQATFTSQNAQLATSAQTTLLQLTQNQQVIQSFNTQEINYLNNSITAATVQQVYLSEPMYNDHLFTLSLMLTPTPVTGIQNFATAVAEAEAAQVWQTAQDLSFKQQAQGSWTAPIVFNKKSIIQQAVNGSSNQTAFVNPGAISIQDVITTIPEQQPAFPNWHNIFRKGNWEFGIAKNNDGTYQGNFTQNSIVPLVNTDSTPIFLQALYNSIFTQYIPPASYYNGTETHVIQIACTLNKVSYPFFMGFYCNGGRWVSGVDQLRYQRRTYGVLGSAPGQSAVWFGETFYMQPSQALQQKVNAVWPLWQFFESSSQAPVWQQLNPAATIATTPLYTDPTPTTAQPLITPGTTIIFTLVTQPTQVTVSAQIAGSKTPFINNVMISKLNPQTFVYHNIGLISAGCAATFKIIHPQALTYPDTSLVAFFQEVQ